MSRGGGRVGEGETGSEQGGKGEWEREKGRDRE